MRDWLPGLVLAFCAGSSVVFLGVMLKGWGEKDKTKQLGRLRKNRYDFSDGDVLEYRTPCT